MRPGGNRPGPAEVWARFDQAVDQLGLAMAEHSVPGEQQALEEVSLVLHEIVDALLEQEGKQWPPAVEEPESNGDEGAGEGDEG